jgi:hypothetical protein
VIESNIDTIASQGHANQLRDLERQSDETRSGPLLAPQFTLGRF